MPKPVLSDSLFNADDVVSAVFAEANLQIANNELGVSNKTSIFTIQSGFGTNAFQAYSFNGFMFVSGEVYHTSGTPADGAVIFAINDSTYHPTDTTYAPNIGYQGDSSYYLSFKDNGDVVVTTPNNLSASAWHVVFNMHYRWA